MYGDIADKASQAADSSQARHMSHRPDPAIGLKLTLSPFPMNSFRELSCHYALILCCHAGIGELMGHLIWTPQTTAMERDVAATT